MTPPSLIAVGILLSWMMSWTALLRGGMRQTEICAGAILDARVNGGR